MAQGGPPLQENSGRQRREEGVGFGDEREFGSYYEAEYTSSGGAGGDRQQVDSEAAGFFDTGDSSTAAGAGALFGTSDDFGGGGFLMHGFDTGGLGGVSQGAAAGRMQQQNAFAPVKIGALMHAFAQDPTAHEISLAPPPACPLYIVRIVGRLSRIEDSPGGPGAAAAGKHGQHAGEVLWDFSMGGRVSFEVEDGSGVLDCDWHLGDDVTPYKQRAVEATLQLNRYVRIYGQLSLLGKPRPSLRVHAVRPVTSAAELLFHEADCCSAFLRMKYAGENLPDPYEESSPQQQQQSRQQAVAHMGMPSVSHGTSATSGPSSMASASHGNLPARDVPSHSSYGGPGGMPQQQEFQQQQEQHYGEGGGQWRNELHPQQQQPSHLPPKPYC